MNNDQNPQGISEMPMPQQPMAQPGMPMPQQPMAQPGMPMPQQPMAQPGMPIPQQGGQVPQDGGDPNDLIGVFVGKNYDKIKTGGLNIAGFLLNGIYLFYRKMPIYGLLMFAVGAALVYFLKSPLICLIFPVAIGVFGSKIYLSHAEKKVADIKAKNQDKDINQVMELIKKAGGTSVVFLIVGVLLEAALVGLSVYVLMFANAEDKKEKDSGDVEEVEEYVDDEEFETTEDESDTTDDTTGATTFTYDITDSVANAFTITAPAGFTDKSDGMKYIFEFKANTGENDNCVSSLSGIKATDAKTFATEMSAKNNSTDLNTVTINNVNWNYFSANTAVGTKYYYTTDLNGKVYLFEYTVETNAFADCLGYRDIILNTVSPITSAQ